VTASSAAAPLLEVNRLVVGYGRHGEVEAVHGVTLAVGAGRIVTVVGPNGAGKTTTMAAIMGLAPSRGTIRYDGIDLANRTVEERVAAGMSLVPERRELFAEMNVADNLELGAFVRRRRRERNIDASLAAVYDLFPRLRERRRQAAGTLSGGERQMLAIGRALMANPRLLMLDEPSLGLAPLIVAEIFRIIADLRRRGVAVLLVEQNAHAALQLADYGYVLESGELVLEGPAVELVHHERIIASYLGLRSAAGKKNGEDESRKEE
jgi:branched-chain amino acid transport system ATP-binding protein